MNKTVTLEKHETVINKYDLELMKSRKTYDTFAVDKDSQLVNMYLDEGHQNEFMEDMESVVDNIKEFGTEEELAQLEHLDTGCQDCLIIKGW